MRAIDRVTEALQRAGSRQIGSDWTCPHHKGGAEKSPSLSVTEGAKGVIMNCHAGCTVEEIVATLGLKMADLFDEPLQKEKTRVTDTYSYVDGEGNEVFQVLRKVSESSGKKTFSQRRKVDGKWIYKLGDVQRVLYRLPELRRAVARGDTIWIVEGEKDVHALEARGEVATTNPGGAGKWRDEYATELRGASHVVIVADKDDVGKAHARQVAASLTDVPYIELVEAKEGKDPSDHFELGYNVDEFVPLSELDQSDDPVQLEEEPQTSGNPMFAKLLEANDIDDIPPPQYLIDSFLVAGSMAVLYGLPGVGKSFLAIDWALCVANHQQWLGHEVQGGEVIYFAAEGLSGLPKRKKAWQHERGVESVSGIRWYPEAVNLLDGTQVGHMVELVDALQPVLIVIDTLGRSMPGGDENAPGPMSEAIEALDSLRKVTSACVLIIHHTPKDGTSPRGHSSLMGAMQTAIRVSNADGDLSVTVEKQKDDEPAELNLRLRRSLDSLVVGTGFGDRASSFVEMEIESALINFAGPEGMPINLFCEVSSISKTTFYRYKEPMLAKGVMVNVGTMKQPRYTHRNLVP